MGQLTSMTALKARFTKAKVPYPTGPSAPLDVRVNPMALARWNGAAEVGANMMRADADAFELKKNQRLMIRRGVPSGVPRPANRSGPLRPDRTFFGLF